MSAGKVLIEPQVKYLPSCLAYVSFISKCAALGLSKMIVARRGQESGRLVSETWVGYDAERNVQNERTAEYELHDNKTECLD